MFTEFRKFAIKGNVIDLAVGVVIGAAFGAIVTSLVDDIITPALLKPALDAVGATDLDKLTVPGTAIKYGNFLSKTISFLMISFVLFMVIKGVNRMKLKEDETPKPPSPEEILLMEIRDLLKKQS
jgi:large conductance mechanosensitive channel